MEKIKGSIASASSLQITEKAPYLDAASKEILSNREFLAIILKYTIQEYADMNFSDIAACIEPDSISRDTEIAPSRTNAGRITGSNTEFSALNEMMSRFDVYFKAVNPKLSNKETKYFLYIDLESQNNFRPGYDVISRMEYYAARALSSQVPAPNKTADYNCLEKVYSIFICRNNVPKELHNNMLVFEIKNTYNTNHVTVDKKSYDLLAMVLITLGDPKYEHMDDIFRVLNALFYPRKEKSYKVLKEYVDYSDILLQEVEKMSGLGESVYFEGVSEGINKGRLEGVNKGRTEARREVVLSMLENGFTLEQIIKIMKMSKEQVEMIIHNQKTLV